ncbi:MAG TPA: Mbeg1-like protein [Cellulomonas sp.]
MPNLLDYLRWRGDLRLDERPFTLVDNLVLSALAYLDLDGLVPAPGAGEVTLGDAAAQVASRRGRPDDGRLPALDARFPEQLARSPRFAGARLSDHVDVLDPEARLQFSAVTIRLEDATTYVAFRGTDNTITGWHEDFAMSFQVTAAQVEAARYLAAIADRGTGPLRVGGHSKGGNLAVYAAMLLPPGQQARLLDVFSNDGPGLSAELVDPDGLDRISDRLTKIVPEQVVIGALFETAAATHVVASDARGLLQHDLQTWQVDGPGLREVARVAPTAAALNGAIEAWLRDATPADRRELTDALFGALGAGGARLTTQIARVQYGSVESVVLALARTRRSTRRPTALAVRVAVRSVAAVDLRALVRRGSFVRSISAVLLGAFFMIVPELAVQIVGSMSALVLAGWGTVRMSRYLARFRTVHRIGWRLVAAQVVLLGLLLAVISRLDVLVVPTNLLLGCAFLVRSWTSARRVHLRSCARPERLRALALLVSSVVAAFLGVGALTTVGHVEPDFVRQAGAYLVLVGSAGILLSAASAAPAEQVRAR